MSKGGGWRASTPRTLPIPSLGMWVSYLTEGTQDMKNNHMSDAQRAAYRKCDKIAEKALAKYGRASADAATEYVREATQGQRARAYERSQAATATECKDAATWQEDYFLTIDTEAGDGPLYSIAGMAMLGINGKYPNWRSLVPAGEPSGVAAQFDPVIVAQFGKVAKLLGKTPYAVGIAHNGKEHAARVNIDSRPSFLGVIMPMRCDVPDSLPDWL